MDVTKARALVSSLVASLCFALPAASQNAGGSRPASYAKFCASCHGEAATGTERGPSLVENRALHSRSEKQIQDLIQNGSPGRMPPFALPEEELQALARWVRSLNVPAFDSAPAGDALSGERFFFGKGQCGLCHMVRGQGEAKGPDLSGIGRELTLGQLEQALDDPAARAASRSDASCPGWAWCPGRGWSMVIVKLNDGSSLRGLLRSEGKHDLQVQTLDGHLRSFLDTDYREIGREGGSSMPVLKFTGEERRDLLAYLGRLDGVPVGPLVAETAAVAAAAISRILDPLPGEWPTYNGILSGNRHSPLAQIDTRNVDRLKLQWTYTLPHVGLQTTPLVSE